MILKRDKVVDKLINEVFGLKSDEVIAITCDEGSNFDMIDTLMKKVNDMGAKATMLKFPMPSEFREEENSNIPHDAFLGFLKNVDCWLDAAQNNFAYSEVFEATFKKNRNLRYMLVGNMDTDILYKIYGRLDVESMTKLTDILRQLLLNAKQLRIKSKKGTHVSYEMEKRHLVVKDDGNAKTPGFCMPPAMVNLVPKFGSVNGVIVVDCIYAESSLIGILKKPMEIIVENGKMIDFNGDESEVIKIKSWLKSFNDPNSYKVGDNNFGLVPYIFEVTGERFIDERMWGAMNWGFGTVNPLDAPPNGQEAKSHMDGICTNVSVWIDDIQIMENGCFVYKELKELGVKLNREDEIII